MSYIPTTSSSWANYNYTSSSVAWQDWVPNCSSSSSAHLRSEPEIPKYEPAVES